MSDNWVGPGWWMASDGKWYPPRGSTHDGASIADAGSADRPPTRWSRTTSDDDADVSAPAPSLSERQAALLASRAERAARIAPTRRVSVAREELEELEEDIIDLDQVDAPDVDLRATAQPESTPENIEIGAAAEGSASSSASGASSSSHLSSVEGAGAGLGGGQSGVPDGGDRSGQGGSGPNQIAGVPMPPPVPPAPERNLMAVPAHDGVGESDDVGDGAGAAEMSNRAADPEDEADPDPGTVSDEGTHDDASEIGSELVPVPPPTLQHAVLPALVENEPTRNRTAMFLLIAATALAVASGLLGAFWLRERSVAADLRDQLVQAEATDDVTEQGLESLTDEVRTLRLQNEQLEQRLTEATALVLELPEGRVTEVAVSFTPAFADEENGRLIAISDAGEYIVWGEGADGPITTSGDVGATPTGLFAAARKAWVSTDAGRIEVLSMVPNEPGLPSVEFEPTSFLAAEDRGYWTYVPSTGEVVRLKKSDGSSTAGVNLPVPVVDLAIGAGSVWALGDDGRVYRINTADLTVQPIDAGEDLISVTAGPDALWTLSAADGSLRRVDPVSGEVLVTVPVGRDPIDATFAGSSVWVALRAGASLIEVDTRTSAVVSRTSLPSEPVALHQGDSGVFVATDGDVRLLRVASRTVDVANDADAGDDDAVDGADTDDAASDGS